MLNYRKLSKVIVSLRSQHCMGQIHKIAGTLCTPVMGITKLLPEFRPELSRFPAHY